MADQPGQPIDLDLEGVLASLSDGVAILDAEGSVLWHNAAFSELVAGHVDDPVLRQMGRQPVDVRVGKRWLRIQSQPHPSVAGASILVLADVTGRYRAEEQLRLSAGMLEALITSAPMAILMLDLEKRVTLWNPAAERMFGWTLAELFGQPYPLVPSDGWAEFEVFFDTVISGEGFAGVEARRSRKDGTHVDIEIATAPIRGVDGAVVGAMAILDDRTEQKQLEARYRQAQKMEAVGRLAGGIAHDFNNALTVILNACEIARLRHPGNPALVDIDTVERAGMRAAELTRQLLAFSRQQVLQPRVVDLNHIVSTSVDMLRRVIGEDLTVETILSSTMGYVRADPGQIERLIMNLALNARDAMPDGGTLTLTTRELPPGHGFGEGMWVELIVADTGTGIATDVMPHIFEPFFTTKDRGKGSGLGLASVYGIVHQSGGEVMVEAIPGQGAIFTVVLPTSVGELDSTVDTPPIPTIRGEGTSVVVVEDEEGVRDVIRTVLASHGFEVVTAASGQEALRVAAEREEPFDVLLTDVVMSGMNGRQLAERFGREWPRARILLMSGYTDDFLVRTGAKAGLPFLHKPFTPAQLLLAVASVLPGSDDAVASPSHRGEMMRVTTEDGAELSVRIKGDGPIDVLLVHGWMTSGFVFDRLLERLGGHIRAVIPDQRGTGFSDHPPEGYTIEQLAADAWRVADEAGLERPTIVGHSMGGQIAQVMAASRPDDVGKLALLCPVPASGLQLPDDAMGLFSTSTGNESQLGTILDLACLKLRPEDRARMVEGASTIEENCLVGTLNAWTAGGFADRLADITAETLVIATDDPFLPTEFLREAVVDAIPNARLEMIKGAGHYVQVESPEETAAALNGFISG